MLDRNLRRHGQPDDRQRHQVVDTEHAPGDPGHEQADEQPVQHAFGQAVVRRPAFGFIDPGNAQRQRGLQVLGAVLQGLAEEAQQQPADAGNRHAEQQRDQRDEEGAGKTRPAQQLEHPGQHDGDGQPAQRALDDAADAHELVEIRELPGQTGAALDQRDQQRKAVEGVGQVSVHAMVVQQRRQRAHQQAGEHHAHPVVGAADDGQRIQQDRLAGVEAGVVELAVQPGNQAPAQARQRAAKGKGPGLVAQYADAGGHSCGLALADQRPGAAGHGGALPLNRRHGQRQPQHGIAEIAFVAARNPGALDQRAGAADHLAGEAGSAVREADHVDGHLERRRHHQRQQRQVQAAHAHGRQADHHAEQAGHDGAGQQR